MSKGKDLVETFNKHYTNIVEKFSGIKPYNYALENNVPEDNTATDLIIKFCEYHPSIAKVKQQTEKISIQNNVNFSSASASNKTSAKKTLALKKPQLQITYPKTCEISCRFVFETSLRFYINIILASGIFPDAVKIAAVSSIDKGTDNKNIVFNSQPVSFLSTFSKIYDKKSGL